MKKFLLSFLISAPLLGIAQVAHPDTITTINYLPAGSGWTASVDHYDAYGGNITTAAQLIDGNTNTYWETYSDGNTTHWAVINMGSLQSIPGVYILLKAGQLNAGQNSPHKMAVFTSLDSIAWTQQGDTIVYPGVAVLNTLVPFSTTVNCKYYKIVSYGQAAVNISETGLYTITKDIPDLYAYDRSGWIVTASSTESGFPATNLLDGDKNTTWQSQWSVGAASYPHILVFDMGVVQPVNQIMYNTWTTGNYNSATDSGTIAFSDDNSNWGTEIPMKFKWDNGVKDTFNLPATQTHRYFRLTIVQNHFKFINPNDVSVSSVATSLTEVGADYIPFSVPVTLGPLSATVDGSAVKLKWTTASEYNSDHFAITRSTDGKNFYTIGTVAAAGQSSIVRNYSFTDVSGLAGINYYQLIETDKDGSPSKSNIAQATIGSGNMAGITIKGVSAHGVKLSINNTNSAQGYIRIYNAAGQTVAAEPVVLNEGSTVREVTVMGATGVYFVVINAGGHTLTAKFFKP